MLSVRWARILDHSAFQLQGVIARLTFFDMPSHESHGGHRQGYLGILHLCTPYICTALTAVINIENKSISISNNYYYYYLTYHRLAHHASVMAYAR